MPHKHFTLLERIKLEGFLDEGVSIVTCAKKLNKKLFAFFHLVFLGSILLLTLNWTSSSSAHVIPLKTVSSFKMWYVTFLIIFFITKIGLFFLGNLKAAVIMV